MGKLTKNQKIAAEKIEAGKVYTLAEAAALLKEITFTKFDASADIDVRLGVDPRKADQNVRGVVSLPNGTGKTVRVLVMCTADAEAAASPHRRGIGQKRHSLPRVIRALVGRIVPVVRCQDHEIVLPHHMQEFLPNYASPGFVEL